MVLLWLPAIAVLISVAFTVFWTHFYIHFVVECSQQPYKVSSAYSVSPNLKYGSKDETQIRLSPAQGSLSDSPLLHSHSFALMPHGASVAFGRNAVTRGYPEP